MTSPLSFEIPSLRSSSFSFPGSVIFLGAASVGVSPPLQHGSSHSVRLSRLRLGGVAGGLLEEVFWGYGEEGGFEWIKITPRNTLLLFLNRDSTTSPLLQGGSLQSVSLV